jgi:preprotein translocase SecF subunit
MKTINFMKYRNVFLVISLVIIVSGLIYGFKTGFKFDIDFKGGTNIQVDLGKAFDNNEVANIVKNVTGQNPLVQKMGGGDSTVSITTDVIPNELTDKVIQELKTTYPNMGEATTKNIQPSYGSELVKSAVKAVVIAVILILLYVAIRFKNLGLPAAITAVVALIHDALIIVAIYAFFKLPINSSFIAVILTIVGYSINDTIIVYDRIRENRRKITKSEELESTINTSISQTMRRTMYTSLTTITAILIVYVFAFINNQTILKEFSLPLVIGILVGTYSSIFVATSLWYTVEKMIGKKRITKQQKQ